MTIVERDVDLMRWILEQKVMTEKQVKKVFWKDGLKDNREAFRRLNKLKKAGFLKTNATGLFGSALYLLTGKGVKELERIGQSSGLGALSDKSYSNVGHDLTITDLRILFRDAGYVHWTSKRILRKQAKPHRIPDGLIYHEGKRLALEYETCHLSKQALREIFFEYHLRCDQIDRVIYVTDGQERVQRLSQEAHICDKLFFVTLQDLQRDRMNVCLKRASGDSTLHDLFV